MITETEIMKADLTQTERYYARFISDTSETQARDFIDRSGREIVMPCGVTATITDIADQPCPNSGNCSAGVKKECWVLKVKSA